MSPSSRAAVCTIIPPYVLEQVAAGPDAHLAEHARRTLEVTADLRRRRASADARPTRGPSPTLSSRRGTPEGPRRTIHDAAGGTTLPGTVVREEGGASSGDTAVDEAYDGLGDTWRLLHDAFERNSLDDRGLPLLASVHYGRDYDNAFWDGEQMVFGDGDGELFLGFTRSLDVIGHELTHGMTQYTAGLNYQGQSGALNEHVSDVFGSLVKQRVLGQTAGEADWLIGADLLAPGVRGTALRSMKEPGTAYDDPRLGRDPQPATMAGYVDTAEDNGGVHINSGIPNRAFALAATALGGHAWETVGQVWYDVLTGDIRADCDFATFASLTVAAARAVDAATEQAVTQAWATVGVDPGGAARPRRRTRRRRTPGAGVPTRNAKVVVRRTGGVAGTVAEASTVLRDLPRADAEQWQSLLASRSLERAAGAPTHPDAFHYEVRVPSRGVAVTVPEPALSEGERDLLERTLRGR